MKSYMEKRKIITTARGLDAEANAEDAVVISDTFDPALLIALGTILSGCGFALSRKKH